MIRWIFWLLASVLLAVTAPAIAQTGIQRFAFDGDGQALTVEFLDDDLVHFELAASPSDGPIVTSPMVVKTDYAGPSEFEQISENEFTTPDLRVMVDADTLCATVSDHSHDPEWTLTTFCPTLDEGELKGMTFTQEGTTDLYGLGEQFRRRGGTDGNWMGDRRLMPNVFGNGIASYEGGFVANSQFPVLYALGEGMQNYALFVDNVYSQYWALRNDPFQLQTPETPLRWYVMAGENLPDLRSDYLELTGRPPVPPRQAFGLWVSEYGYENWDELQTVLESMRASNFPLDGFMLDLQWFGGIGDDSQMGSLMWDEENFPDPAAFIASLRDEYGLRLMTIEEPYVAATSAGYDEAVDAGILVTACADDCAPVHLDSWWGAGGMVDWTDPAAAAWWHDERRQPLVDDGIFGHWTDLGEPEDYSEAGWYAGSSADDPHDHASWHNLYNLLWAQSIQDGYARNDPDQRPFILSRSGTSGIQRTGAAMWSGDIGANMPSLSEQMNVQMQMSLSGVDYFGSDVGGFYRQAADLVLDADEMYSVWFANSALIDVPLRPHAANGQNQYHTAPSLVGDVSSNLANARLRTALGPYLYTLAHEANQTGAAVFPPLVYTFQDDPAVRALGGQKMIGPQMMMAALADYDLTATDVYLPAGGWFNFRTNEFTASSGETITVPASVDGLIEAPLFVRDGAIMPTVRVDEDTLNSLGMRRDGTLDTGIIFNVFHAQEDGQFTLIEDDGESNAYRSGVVRETPVSHSAQADGSLVVTVGPANGDYTGAPSARSIEIRLVSPDRVVGQVLLNGDVLPAGDGERGWEKLEDGTVVVRVGVQPVDAELVVTFASAEETAQTERPLLLAHFMPWYQTPDVSGYWGWHWTMNHFDPEQVDAEGRPQIASQFLPLTGPYDSADPAILEYQTLLMKLAGIDGVIADWYGTADYADYPAINAATEALFSELERAGLKFTIAYEDRTLQTMTNDSTLNTDTALVQGQADFEFVRDAWMSSDSYVKAGEQPLVFVYGPVYFRQPSDWTTLFSGIQPAPGLVTLDGRLSFAALASYPWPPMEMAGGTTMNPAALDSYLERFYRNASRGEYIVGSSFPGFHDIYEEAGVRSSFGRIDPQDGETLRHTLQLALDQNANIVQLVTWNDYGEGTTIEPTVEYGYQYLEIVQAARRELDPGFMFQPDDLRLPLRLFELRRAHADDPAINGRLDGVFDAVVNGDLAVARAILDEVEGT